MKYQNLKGGGINLNIEFTNDNTIMQIIQQDEFFQDESIQDKLSMDMYKSLTTEEQDKLIMSIYESMSNKQKYKIWNAKSLDNIEPLIFNEEQDTRNTEDIKKKFINIGKKHIIEVLFNAIPISFLKHIDITFDVDDKYKKFIHYAKYQCLAYSNYKLRNLFDFSYYTLDGFIYINIAPQWDKLETFFNNIKLSFIHRLRAETTGSQGTTNPNEYKFIIFENTYEIHQNYDINKFLFPPSPETPERTTNE